MVTGEASVDDYSGGMRLQAQQICTVDELQLAHAKALHLYLDVSVLPHDFTDVLAQTFATVESGDVRLLLHLVQQDRTVVVLAGSDFGYALSTFFMDRLQDMAWLSYDLGYEIPKFCQEIAEKSDVRVA